MSLSKEAEKKLSNIKYPTNLLGFYKFKDKQQAIYFINKNHDIIEDDGSFYKREIHANDDPIYQEISAAIDYYKFDIIRPHHNLKFHKKIKN